MYYSLVPIPLCRPDACGTVDLPFRGSQQIGTDPIGILFFLRFPLHVSLIMATIWRTENFSRGLHTKPARTEGGDLYAADIENLQVSNDGFLKLRINFTDSGIASNPNEITGVASTADYLFLLRSDGKLWLHHTDGSLAKPEPVEGLGDDLEGRISIVSPGAGYVVLTSEGKDRGYWIRIAGPQTEGFGIAYPLGISPPPSIHSDLTISVVPSDGTGYPGPGTVGYAFTWLRQAPNQPFDGMESNPSVVEEQQVTLSPDSNLAKVVISDVKFPADSQITDLAIYRTRRLEVGTPQTLDLTKREFRRIGTMSRSQASFEDDNSADWSKGVVRNSFNDRMPEAVKSIHYHQGRIFAPTGDRLVFTGFDGTVPKFWTFPPQNFIRPVTARRVDFCVSHREVLLFGGTDGLFRLTGGDAFDFEADQISGVGPLDGYSWAVMKDTLGFLGTRGLYLTDASSVEFISDEALDRFFDAQIVKRGSVVFFQDNAILFFVELQAVGGTEITDHMFLFDDRYWVRWSDEKVGQLAVIGEKFYAAEGSALKRIQWGEGDNTDPDLTWAWESNLIHGQESGAGNLNKRFGELLLSAEEGTRITLKTWIDRQRRPTEKQITTRDDLYFQRIPIERIGRRLRFRLEGKGPVEIRGIQLEGEV